MCVCVCMHAQLLGVIIALGSKSDSSSNTDNSACTVNDLIDPDNLVFTFFHVTDVTDPDMLARLATIKKAEAKVRLANRAFA